MALCFYASLIEIYSKVPALLVILLFFHLIVPGTYIKQYQTMFYLLHRDSSTGRATFCGNDGIPSGSVDGSL